MNLVEYVRWRADLRVFAGWRHDIQHYAKWQRAHVEAIAEHPQPSDLHGASSVVVNGVRVMDFQDMLCSFPAMSSEEKHDDRPLRPSWLNLALCSAILRLPQPTFCVERYQRALQPDECRSMLMSRRLNLPVQTSDVENILLAEAGVWRFGAHGVFDFPACVFGDKCVGKTDRIPGLPDGGVVLTSVMYEHELNNMIVNHVRPNERRPCVLCCRKALQDMALTLLHNHGTVSVSRRAVYQIYRNLVDEPGGYQRCYVRFPPEGRWAGFLVSTGQTPANTRDGPGGGGVASRHTS